MSPSGEETGTAPSLSSTLLILFEKGVEATGSEKVTEPG